MSQLLLAASAVAISTGVACVFHSLWTRPSRLRDAAQKASLAVCSLLVAFTLVDLILGSLLVRSDGFNFTLAAKQWNRRHWKPINSLGYRDRNWTEADLAGRQVLFVLGDSVVAGHGIERVENRFSNVLGRQLGSTWAVLNVARRGWDSQQEAKALLEHPARPQHVILSYYSNDILRAAVAAGFSPPVLVPRPERLGGVIEFSPLINHLYWRLHRWRRTGEYNRIWRDYLGRCYADGEIWAAHELELEQLIVGAQHRGATLRVVVWPRLADVPSTACYTARVAAFFQEHGVPALDLAPRLSWRPPLEMMVNSQDGHPNPAIHEEVGMLLASWFDGAAPPP